jgi:hypothetical protein
MSSQLIGSSSSDVPFNRTFFNVTLGEMIEQNGKEKPVKLTLFLSDGSTLDVCMIDELSDQYLAVRAYQGQSDSCEINVQLIPYGLIYRIEIAPKAQESSRVGFQWKPSARKGLTTRRSK